MDLWFWLSPLGRKKNYYKKLRPIYSFPEQLVFINKTSKDGSNTFRRYAWSKRGTKATVRLPFSCENCVSIFAALDYTGFMAWKCTAGTFSWKQFRNAFSEKILPHLNPWPLPRSIVIMVNALVHRKTFHYHWSIKRLTNLINLSIRSKCFSPTVTMKKN